MTMRRRWSRNWELLLFDRFRQISLFPYEKITQVIEKQKICKNIFKEYLIISSGGSRRICCLPSQRSGSEIAWASRQLIPRSQSIRREAVRCRWGISDGWVGSIHITILSGFDHSLWCNSGWRKTGKPHHVRVDAQRTVSSFLHTYNLHHISII